MHFSGTWSTAGAATSRPTRSRRKCRTVMKILLVGYGKMGRLIGELAPQYGCEVAGVVDPAAADGRLVTDSSWTGVDAAIDFTTPDAVMTNVPALAKRGINV